MLAGNAAYDPAATFLITRTSPTSGSSVTFSSIPTGYASIQVRFSGLNNGGSLYIQLNGDTGTNYSRHAMYGDGSGVFAYSGADQNKVWLYLVGASTTYPTTGIIDIHDYTSTTKNKTIRSIAGKDANVNGAIELASGAWLSTSAVTSLTLTFDANTITSGSTFALYGMK